jgi:hypothetical protein
MRSLTGHEVAREHARLEREAALALGRILFEYSRLDMDVGLMLAWANGDHDPRALSEKLEGDNFNSRLENLKQTASATFPGDAAVLNAYIAWLDEAHRMRQLRNDLFHGRWGINPTAGTVSCIRGLPASPTQREVQYSIEQLNAVGVAAGLASQAARAKE